MATRLLKSGYSLAILVGGEREQLLSRRGEQRVFLNERKGFVRLALRFGLPLVIAAGGLSSNSPLSFGLPLLSCAP